MLSLERNGVCWSKPVTGRSILDYRHWLAKLKTTIFLTSAVRVTISKGNPAWSETSFLLFCAKLKRKKTVKRTFSIANAAAAKYNLFPNRADGLQTVNAKKIQIADKRTYSTCLLTFKVVNDKLCWRSKTSKWQNSLKRKLPLISRGTNVFKLILTSSCSISRVEQ